MDPIRSSKKKKNKSKKKRLGSCFGQIVVDRLEGQPALAFVPFSPPPKDIAGKDQFHRRSFSGVVKAMFFGTSMAKKFRKTKPRGKLELDQTQTESDSSSNSKPKSHKIPNPITLPIASETDSSFQKTTSSPSLSNSTSPIAYSSSASSLKSSSTSSRQKVAVPRMARETEGRFGSSCFGSDVGLCLVLISLSVLVFWGKICAILCTSSWLFFVPRLNFAFRSSGGAEEPSMEVYSEEQKKKVVLEGLLERNRLIRDQ